MCSMGECEGNNLAQHKFDLKDILLKQGLISTISKWEQEKYHIHLNAAYSYLICLGYWM